ncbi:MAG TPA: SAM-dependent methyltransferase, partial [Smithellaceae bacterium]|nr:SAM-dependent methyltransferase [Smithellaceae bacterium]
DVEELDTHGGSLRVFAQRTDAGTQAISEKVADLLDRETAAGMDKAAYYRGFQEQANKVKNDFLAFLLEAARQGKTVAAYGAAAKGNTLLNYAGVRPDLLPYVVDKNPNKQGKYLPGSRIPIVSEDHLRKQRPDYVVILPWNLKAEIMEQLSYVRDWGGRFVTAIPCLDII